MKWLLAFRGWAKKQALHKDRNYQALEIGFQDWVSVCLVLFEKFWENTKIIPLETPSERDSVLDLISLIF